MQVVVHFLHKFPRGGLALDDCAHIVHVPGVIRRTQLPLDVVIRRSHNHIGRHLRYQTAHLHPAARNAFRCGNIGAVQRQPQRAAIAADSAFKEPHHVGIIQRAAQFPQLYFGRNTKEELCNVHLHKVPVAGFGRSLSHPALYRVCTPHRALTGNAAITVFVERLAVNRPRHIVRGAVYNAVIKRQAADDSFLGVILIKLVKRPRLVLMPLEPIHRIDQIILKEIGVLKHTILIALMFSRQQITIIHIVEGCKLLKNMSVFFQSNATP